MSTNVHTWSAPQLDVGSGSSDRRRHLLVDGTVAIALVVYTVLAALPFPPPPPYGWRGYGVVLASAAVAVAARRIGVRWAHASFCLVLLTTALLRVPGPFGNTALIALMISTYSFAAYTPWRRTWVGWPMAVAPLLTVMLIRRGETIYLVPIVSLEMGMAWVFGSVRRQRVGLARALDDRALQLDVPPEETERFAISQERARIARDLQALVTESIDSMVARARATRAVMRQDPEAATRSAHEVAQTGRAALQELRRLLDVLRGSGPSSAASPASMEELRQVIEQARATGAAVTFEVSGDVTTVASPSQRAAYRLVEEAVAMATERDGPGGVDLHLDVRDAELLVVANAHGTGEAVVSPVAPFDPRLAGLHERVALTGGDLRARLTAGGGFELEARLPVRDRADGVLIRRIPEPVSDNVPASARGAVHALIRATTASVRSRPWLQDILIAAALGTVSLGEVLLFPEPFYDAERSWRAVLMVYVIAATLVARRRFPVGALLVAGAFEFAHHLLMLRWTNVILLIFSIHIFTVASRRSRRMAVIAVLVAIAAHGIFLARITTGAFSTGGLGIPHTAAVTILLTVGLRIFGMWIFAAYAGRTLAAVERLNTQLATRIEHLMVRRDVQARLAIAEERRRVARELHDVVGHGLSIMVLQSGAVSSLVSRDLSRADETLQLIERMGDRAKAELDALVDLLGPDTPTVLGRPRPIDELVADARVSGLDVSLIVEGDGGTDGPMSIHAYRIVQEALTNASKYAPGAHIAVRLAFRDGSVEVEVRNDAPRVRPPNAQPPLGSGYGLVGMRERVGLFGGELSAQTRPDGGFEVRARLPRPAPA